MPTSKIEKRLTRQLASKGMSNSKGMAHTLLKKKGIITESGELTKKGKVRDKLGPAGRAKSRAAKYSGKHKSGDYKYDKKTNMAILKGKK